MADKASKPAGRFPRKAELPDPFAPCPNAALSATTRTFDNLFEPAYWKAVCPELTVNGELKVSKPLKRQEKIDQEFKQQIHDEGVFQVGPHFLHWTVDIDRLARNMAILMQHGWPPTFLLMYDEVWALIQRASSLMAATTGNACNMDVLCWYVDPNRGDAGFSPHRDRQPNDSPATFRAGDGSAMYSTCWVPLTDSCPENSCLYMVPRWADPGYFDGDDDDGPDPLTVALSSKEAFQAVRAFPAEAGSAIVFTHRIIHWGSRGRKGYHTPRLAVSWGCADDAYEPPYFSRKHLPYPPMALRAALACGQMLAYHERFAMTKRQLSLYYKFFTAHAAEFHESYRSKVKKEFVAASKESVAAAPPTPLAGPPAGAAAAAATAVAAVSGGYSNGQGVRANGARGSSGGGSGEEGSKAKKAKKGQVTTKDGAADVAMAGSGGAPCAAGDAPAKKKVPQLLEKDRKDEKAEISKGKTKKEKKRSADQGNSLNPGDEAAAADAEGVATGKASKKAKKAAAAPNAGAAVALSGKHAAPIKASAGEATAAASAKPAAAAAAAVLQQTRGGKDGKDLRKVAVAEELESPGKKAAAPQLLSGGDANVDDDDNDDEEEGPGWEGVLVGAGGAGGDSEDEVMEDALDAMLDAELAGDVEGLQDDFDDFVDDM